MGIDGLYKFISRNIPEIFETVSIVEIRGKSCIIDGMQHIYSQLIYMRSREKEVITDSGQNISHIHGLINSLTYYLKNGIIPVFIFDGKAPEIKRRKIEERKRNLKENLNKLKKLESIKNDINEIISFRIDENDFENQLDNEKDNELVFGTPPSELFNIEEEIKKMNNLQEEYKKLYRKSIVLKDYYVKDWILILELLGIPVVKAEGEADPLCAYIAKRNEEIYGILSDDSDMLIFGAPMIMRKTVNQQFTLIKLDNLICNINILLEKIYGKKINFSFNNLLDFSILLGTDYETFTLNKILIDSLDILKYYVENNMDYKKIISEEQYSNFEKIRNYYKNNDFSENYSNLLEKPIWDKPKFMELKQKLLELDVDEDFIDRNCEFLDICYNKIKKGKIYPKYNMDFNIKTRTRSKSFDSKIDNDEIIKNIVEIIKRGSCYRERNSPCYSDNTDFTDNTEISLNDIDKNNEVEINKNDDIFIYEN